MSTGGRGAASKRKDLTQSTSSRKKRNKPAKKLCCCSWGAECQRIRDAVLLLPDGFDHDLWKTENIKFNPNLKCAKSEKFEEVIRRHLGVTGHPKEYSIAVHHWKLPLLRHRNN